MKKNLSVNELIEFLSAYANLYDGNDPVYFMGSETNYESIPVKGHTTHLEDSGMEKGVELWGF